MAIQQQNYEFYLNRSTAGLRQIFSELSEFAQDYLKNVLIPNKSQNQNITHSLGVIKVEEGLLAIVNHENIPDINGENILYDFVMPVLRYDSRIYRASQSASKEAISEGLYASGIDSFILDWRYTTFKSEFKLKLDFTDEGIKKMLQDTLALQRFLQRISQN